MYKNNELNKSNAPRFNTKIQSCQILDLISITNMLIAKQLQMFQYDQTKGSNQQWHEVVSAVLEKSSRHPWMDQLNKQNIINSNVKVWFDIILQKLYAYREHYTTKQYQISKLHRNLSYFEMLNSPRIPLLPI